MEKLYKQNVVTRSFVIWLGFMVIQWTVFTLGLLTHPAAYSGSTADIVRTRGWEVFAFIIANNSLLLLLIAAGNLFVRFGVATPGLIIVLYEAVVIGWTAGTNAFMEPFASIAAANAAFLRIGLWETTAYAIICAVTMTKSLNIAATFPAKVWSETRQLKNLRLTRAEIALTIATLACLIGATLVEAFWVG